MRPRSPLQWRRDRRPFRVEWGCSLGFSVCSLSMNVLIRLPAGSRSHSHSCPGIGGGWPLPGSDPAMLGYPPARRDGAPDCVRWDPDSCARPFAVTRCATGSDTPPPAPSWAGQPGSAWQDNPAARTPAPPLAACPSATPGRSARCRHQGRQGAPARLWAHWPPLWCRRSLRPR